MYVYIIFFVPPLSRCRQGGEGSHTSQSSYRESRGSSCHHKRETGVQPSRTEDNRETKCPIESCNRFHGFSPETCSREYPLEEGEG